MARKRTETMWMPLSPNGRPMWWAVSWKRMWAQQKIVDKGFPRGRTWKQLYRRGWRCVKATTTWEQPK